MDSKKTSEKLARQLAKVRRKRVQQFKERISSGQYQVKNQEVAKALLVS